MFICQAFCILQPPATVALTWHHLGSWDSSIYLHSSSPYLLTFICHRTHSRPVKGAIWEQKLCPHHCTNRLSLIKLSCFSDFADGYFHCEPHLVMKFVVSQEECYTQFHTHTNTQIQSISSLLGGTNSIRRLKMVCCCQSCLLVPWG